MKPENKRLFRAVVPAMLAMAVVVGGTILLGYRISSKTSGSPAYIIMTTSGDENHVKPAPAFETVAKPSEDEPLPLRPAAPPQSANQISIVDIVQQAPESALTDLFKKEDLKDGVEALKQLAKNSQDRLAAAGFSNVVPGNASAVREEKTWHVSCHTDMYVMNGIGITEAGGDVELRSELFYDYGSANGKRPWLHMTVYRLYLEQQDGKLVAKQATYSSSQSSTEGEQDRPIAEVQGHFNKTIRILEEFDKAEAARLQQKK